MKIKLQDIISCISKVLIFLFVIFIRFGGLYLVYLDQNNINLGLIGNIFFWLFFLYFFSGLIFHIYFAFKAGIKLLDDHMELYLFNKSNQKSSYLYWRIISRKNDFYEKPMRYIIDYKDLNGYGLNENRIFFSLKDKTIIKFDEEKISDKDRNKLFINLTNKTNLKPLYETDLIVNYDEYKKYGKVVKSKLVDENTKYEIRLQDKIYHVIIFRKIFTDNYKEYQNYRNGLDILWIEDKTGVHITDNLKSAIEIAKEYSE